MYHVTYSSLFTICFVLKCWRTNKNTCLKKYWRHCVEAWPCNSPVHSIPSFNFTWLNYYRKFLNHALYLLYFNSFPCVKWSSVRLTNPLAEQNIALSIEVDILFCYCSSLVKVNSTNARYIRYRYVSPGDDRTIKENSLRCVRL